MSETEVKVMTVVDAHPRSFDKYARNILKFDNVGEVILHDFFREDGPSPAGPPDNGIR